MAENVYKHGDCWNLVCVRESRIGWLEKAAVWVGKSVDYQNQW